MSKTIIIGDCHIGKGLAIGKPSVDGSLNSRVQDQSNLLNWILSKGIEHNVDRFILTGDVFEEPKPETNLVVLFINWLKHCADHNIECHIIFGNHDLKRVGSRYSSVLDVVKAADIDGVYIYNQLHTLHTFGASFTLMPFRDKNSLNANTIEDAIKILMDPLHYEASSIPIGNRKVCVGHLALAGAFYTDEVDDTTNELMIPSSSFSDYDYVWMGHVHKPQVLHAANPRAAHIGSMDISNFGELDQQKILILFNPFSEKIFEEIKIPSRPLRRIRVDVGKEDDPTEHVLKIIDDMEEEDGFKTSLVKIEVKIQNEEAPELDRDKVLSKLKSLGVYNVSSFSESRSVSAIPEDKKRMIDDDIKPKSAVKLYADIIEHETEKEKSDYITLCNDIIDEELLKGK